MSLDWYSDILEFHEAFDHHIGEAPSVPPDKVRILRYKLVQEEMKETLEAIWDDDLVGIADGIADSIVVLLGTAIAYGINFQPIWDEVHRTNMAKVGGEKREDGKSLKPEGWEPPDIKSLLIKQGYEV